MRVGFIAHDGAGEMGGVASWMGDLTHWLRGAGVDARVYGYVRPGETPLFNQLEAAGVPVIRSEHATGTRTLESRASWLADVLVNDRIDILIPNYFLSGFVAASWLGSSGPHTIPVLHSDDVLYRRLLHEVQHSNAFFPASALVAVSKELERMSYDALGQSALVARIPYGVTTPVGTARRDERELRVVFSGRLEQEQKRILDTVSVACDAVAADPSIRVDFLGDGSKRAECEHLVATRGASDAVRFLGRLPAAEVRRRLPNYHAFLLLPDYEGLPVALLEAAAAGVVPVCTRIRSGIGEIVEDGVTGLLVEDRRDAVGMLLRLRRDAGLWQRCADAVRERGTQYTVDACGRQWIALMEQVLLSDPPRGTRRFGKPVPPFTHEFHFDDGLRETRVFEHAIRKVLAGVRRRLTTRH